MFLDWKNWIVKLTILPKAICRLSVMPVKLPRKFFTELGPKILQFVQKHKRPQIANAVLFLKKIYFIFWLWWVLVAALGLSLVASSGNCLWQCLGFSLWWPCLLWSAGSRHTGSVVAVHRFSSCGRWAQLHSSMWDLPGSGTKLVVFVSLQGGFLATGPSGKPGRSTLEKVKQSWSNQAP